MEHELIDYYDENGNHKGVIDKAIAHKEGLWHKSVHAWIINSKNQILLQKRCALKTFYPNFWDCSFAGHVGAGENNKESALREGEEEIGISFSPDDLEYAFTNKEILKWNDKDSREFVYVYIIKKDIAVSDIKYQKEEVEEARYFELEELFNGKIENLFPHQDEYDQLKEILGYTSDNESQI